MNPPLLDAVALRCERGDRLLFDGLDLRVRPGELLQIGGVNGSGKTSLLRILAGLLPAEGGQVQRPSATDLLWLGHAPGIADGLSVLENLLSLACLRQALRRADALAALAAMGLEAWADERCGQLSAGQRRRVTLARLYLPAAPRLWLLDEPFTALDAATCAALECRLQAHCAADGAVVLTSHRELQTPIAGHRRLVLDGGR
ncbi:cytochrome c biogenesis heme-transporting ATPase CcmA [Pseudomonas oryzihabitans]|uniref:cytochrome c biogenesis heme-transporting ATPase CcmA n=1 Tax=Pseudomonas oryzihabitans TaxID=47885 RepID=UPI00289548E8|nr:cytochrome c biogenesis heme-transporting ATPase CcmA [Pseudomonas oryzihabitans]MDT3718037.1 cytochrome c biogenesis heme-transporting ATPase CcmA [Pseudomonas oryzihabitans]